MTPRPTRRALVVGINYPGTPYALSGCVADADLWLDALDARGFAVTRCTNENATRGAILAYLGAMVRDSKPGDCVAYVYSGHGTYLRDPSGDEADGYDEAQCPWDFDSGAYLIDDDLRAVAAGLPAGAGFTTFSDSCHSATVTRLIGAGSVGRLDPTRRAKRIVPTRAMHEAHAAFRAGDPWKRQERAVQRDARSPLVGVDALRSVSFSACLANEVAYESEKPGGGVSGDFTAVAVPILRAAGWSLTRAGFMRRVLAAMGEQRAQTPYLDAAPGVERRALWSWTVAP